MKTGTVAKRFDVDQKTIKIWTDMFPDYFSDGALGEGRTQRDYQMEDLIIINTIRVERAKNMPFEQIGAKLAADQAASDLRVAQAEAEKRRAAAVALEQEMQAAIQENRAKVVLAEAEVPMAIAEAFKTGRLGVMDYYNLRNLQADTSMRNNIAGVSGGADNGPSR